VTIFCESREERRVEVKSVSIITTTVKGMIDYYETKEHPVKSRIPDFGSAV